ncbi:MAG: LysE family translocator [Opitutales bacterium]
MHRFLQGLVIGVAIAAPVGPVGLLCIRRAILDGRLAGLVTGLGAATADALYGLMAALGVSAVTNLLLEYARAIQLLGGLFLLYLGVHILRSRVPTAETRATHAPSLHAAYVSTVALTLANPITIVAFVGIFSALGIHTIGPGRDWSAALLVSGVFLGSCAWWLLLSTAASWISGHINAGVFRIMNYLSGGLIATIGLYELVQLALQL